MQTAMYGHPTYSPFIYSPSLATLILSQCLVTTTSNSIFAFWHTSTYPSKQENHSCEQFDNTYLSKSSSKFLNYLMNIYHAGKNSKPYKNKTSAPWSHIKQKKTKSKELTNQSIHVCLKFLDASILELGHYVNSNYINQK